MTKCLKWFVSAVSDGVGKSELAKKYIAEFSQEYDNKVIWLNAENYQSLADSFHRLAYESLKINPKNGNDEKRNISSLLQDIYRYFSNGKSLFIFDNAEKYGSQNEFDHGIDNFLPSLPSNYNKPHILITSRNRKWPKVVKVLTLDVFNENEAEELIRKSLDIENDLQENNIRDLGNELQFFPLALQQALAYIRVQDDKLRNLGLRFTISNYMERYREKTKEVLSFGSSEDSENEYTKPVFSTWTVTLDAITQREHSNGALDILNVLSYLAPENISTKTFLILVDDEHEKLGSAFELLNQYSMINLENTRVRLHRLVQQVIRIQLKAQNREETVLRKALQLFNEDNLLENVEHAIFVWNYSSSYNKLVIEFSAFPSHIAVVLIENYMYEKAYSFGLNVLKALKAMPHENNYILAANLAAKHNVAGALSKLGQYGTALQFLQENLRDQEILFGPNSPATFTTKAGIALALSDLGKYNEALNYYQEALNRIKFYMGKIILKLY